MVEVREGDALELLQALPADEPPYDLVFLDADKRRSAAYVRLLTRRGLLAPHALLLVDNTLWKGEVLDLLAPRAAATASEEGPPLAPQARRSRAIRDALHAFSLEVADDPSVSALMLPLRDGLTWVQPAAPAPAAAAVADIATDASHRRRAEVGSRQLAAYLTRVCSPEHPALAACRRETAELWGSESARRTPSPQQGRLLQMLVRLARPARVLELGTFTGYASVWMGLGLGEGGRLLSLERDARSAAVARRHLAAAGVPPGRVEISEGAGRSLPACAPDEGTYDMAIWHLDAAGGAAEATGRDAETDAEATAQGLLRQLSPGGVLVLLQPGSAPAAAAARGGDAPARQRGAAAQLERAQEAELDEGCARLYAALRADCRLRVVALPSPAADGGIFSLVSFAAAGDV